ncbi:TonB-dependent receptor [Halioxenophilus aromaticivorans]|uniref:TonB-dependent receptor n=2 Tax=Halioxenophilus aromaticivorans TaxID=1306992 RepID=A0AAV3U381_9ALTE
MCCVGFPTLGAAQTGTNTAKPASDKAASRIEEVTVTVGQDQLQTTSGSASIIDKAQIEAFDAVDLTSLLSQTPGVYIRQEDGYGLRPNIGLRGATSERSQKITLMEDGVLIAPAPYSAPAAYYLPNVNRMSMVEVFKGPSVVKYGPHTVGGAINLVTAPTPNEQEGKVEATLGSDNFQKYRVFYGDRIGQFSYWIDALHFGSDGFKSLDGGGDTGFERNDINAKVQWHSASDSRFYQEIQVKLGYADETSQETYLGLTDDDFAASPSRRYAASALDEFDSEHSQIHIFHFIDLGSGWNLTTRAYHNEYQRAWFKFDGFTDENATAAALVLAQPQDFGTELALIRGQANSNGSSEWIDITDFDRSYGSNGVAFDLRKTIAAGDVTHNLEAGLRLHHDYVERDHQPYAYAMVDGNLVPVSTSVDKETLNEWETDAVAVFINDTIEWQKWKIDLGLRVESIDGTAEDKLAGTTASNTQDVVLPGVGVYYQFSQAVGLLAGINKGFSPASPGAADDVDPEESLNLEYGVRYKKGALNAEVIGFFSQYDNLLGRCRVSDPGCVAGEEFNGGDIEVGGFEFTGQYVASLGGNLQLPIDVVYTYTESAFQSSFLSSFSQWNPGYFEGVSRSIRQGDELPYLPEHQLRLQAGVTGLNWQAQLAVKHISEMREVPGYGSYEDGTSTEALTTVDLSIGYDITEQLAVKLIAENLTDEQEIVSRRPFGARSNLPRQFKAGVSYTF